MFGNYILFVPKWLDQWLSVTMKVISKISHCAIIFHKNQSNSDENVVTISSLLQSDDKNPGLTCNEM